MAKKQYIASPLIGKFLVSLPQMRDPRFHNSVIYICGHDSNGAMGIIINRHFDSLSFFELLDQLDIPYPPSLRDIKLNYGGPVELGRGFILHTSDYMHSSSLMIAEDIILTSNLDVLKQIAQGDGPEKFILALGYTGWGKGQLEEEIKNDGWIQIDADLETLYSQNVERKWHQVLGKIGVDPDMLSLEGGQA